jgi:two-component system response regulator YesN
MFAAVGKKHIESWMLRFYVAMDVYLSAKAFVQKLRVDKDQIELAFGAIDAVEVASASVGSTKECLTSLLENSINLRDDSAQKRYDRMIEKAREYIESNYASEDVSLKTVAAAVNVSPTYFSALFSQETGQSFIECLTDVRMKKARELLRCTGIRTSEIAYSVGYRDPHYFSYIFKKINGTTPRDFRMQGKPNCGGGTV